MFYIICDCGIKYTEPKIWPIKCFCGLIINKDNSRQTTKDIDVMTTVSFNKLNNGESWGNKKWRLLHTKINNVDSFNKWKETLPCGSCKQDFNKLITDYPPDFSSQEKFFEWTVKIHNKVNEKLNKPTFTLEQAKERWCIINQSDF